MKRASGSTRPAGVALPPMVFAPAPRERFLLDSFQIPPFLLPIYQAAGIEYNVPWQVLAAINWIETDYGRNLSVSSAGAVGWMQFLPSTWKEWGVDATGSGDADPYNPTDAIFTAARYLQAAGASKDLAKAIFAYNHATWYVQSVLLRARLIETIPQTIIGALSQMVAGRFPITSTSHYRDQRRGWTDISAVQGAAVVAVNDGIIERVGHGAALGRFVVLRDAAGNTYTYAHLGAVSEAYALPKPRAAMPRWSLGDLSGVVRPPTGAASAGAQPSGGRIGALISRAATPAAGQRRGRDPSPRQSEAVAGSPRGEPLVKERLFAHPWRAASFSAGGDQQVSAGRFSDYVSDSLHLARGQYVLRPLRKGATVVAGTILGHLAARGRARLRFMIRPAGRRTRPIDPKAILDAWKLLTATGIYHRASAAPVFGPGAANPVAGEIVLTPQRRLAREILDDPRIHLGDCMRSGIEAGRIDRRVLAAVAYLAAGGLNPTLPGIGCGQASTGATSMAADRSLEISSLNGVQIAGHQGFGTISDLAIRLLLSLSGQYHPASIVSLMSYAGQSSTVRLPDHADRIQVTFGPLSADRRSLPAARQWRRMMTQLGGLAEPGVPSAVSAEAIRR